MLFPPKRPIQRPPYHHGMYPPPNQQQQYWQPPYQQPPWQHHANQPPKNPGNSPMPGIMSAFQTQDGKFDFNKAMNTFDQVVKTANQVSPIVKQVGQYFIKK
ncbi:YppG family protein [Bacillus shivajii]|uniref:YppG family protein n=1 Tax=Bacillus shivajii TaxID=1983719 RepID=UPI001CFB2B46|nr:YppG family protein [Bacillus shivajii]UCZ51904.1 YppG family protein [Bacillus shivajii]